MTLLGERYPEYAAFPMPRLEEILIIRATPKVISVLDYAKGFGHTALVAVENHPCNRHPPEPIE
jgi:hypothetical protein